MWHTVRCTRAHEPIHHARGDRAPTMFLWFLQGILLIPLLIKRFLFFKKLGHNFLPTLPITIHNLSTKPITYQTLEHTEKRRYCVNTLLTQDTVEKPRNYSCARKNLHSRKMSARGIVVYSVTRILERVNRMIMCTCSHTATPNRLDRLN